MAKAFDGVASDIEQLSQRVEELERRVSTLEKHPQDHPASASASASDAQPQQTVGTWQDFSKPAASAGVFPVVGKAVLGIAGAYLLRAVAESEAVPKLPLLIAAVGYACLWLLWAVRKHADDHFASITYSITATLILTPLLWESTVRFQALSAPASASVLVGFVILALALAWQKNLQVIPWIATLASVATAVALIVATRELVPFTAGLLVVALATEVAVGLGQRLSERAIPAAAADFAVWLLVYVMTLPEGVPPEYRPVSASTIALLCLSLLAVYAGSIGIRTFALRHRLTLFEIVQGIVVLVLAAFGTLRTNPNAAPAFGVFFLVAAAVCYWGALWRFARDEQNRNRRVCATYAVALLLAGSLLLFPVNLQAPFLCLAAVTAAFLYMRNRKLTLGMHVPLYLGVAAIFSGLLNLAGNALAGTVPSALNAGAWVVAISAALCYAIEWRTSTDQWKTRLLWIVPCALVASVAAALGVMVIVRLGWAAGMLSASGLSVVRTVVICAIALILGFSSSRFKRAELEWVAYAAVAFGTLKLLFEDLRFGNPASLVASLLFYGLILILIPKLTRLGRQQS